MTEPTEYELLLKDATDLQTRMVEIASDCDQMYEHPPIGYKAAVKKLLEQLTTEHDAIKQFASDVEDYLIEEGDKISAIDAEIEEVYADSEKQTNALLDYLERPDAISRDALLRKHDVYVTTAQPGLFQ